METTSYLTVVGLFYDLIGACLMVFGIINFSNKQIISKLTQFWTKVEDADKVIENILDTITGLCLIFIGFLLQFLSAVNFFKSTLFPICSVFFLFFILIFYGCGFRRFMVGKWIKAIKPELEKRL